MNFMTCILTKYSVKVEMGGACGTYGRRGRGFIEGFGGET